MERDGDRHVVIAGMLHDHTGFTRQGFELLRQISQILVGVRHLEGRENNFAKGTHHRDHALSL
jgi:hypothetical protein